jgi:hypothetical protein
MLRTLIVAVVLSVLASTSGAQDRQSHWGVAGSFVPAWTTEQKLFEVLADFETADLHGNEFDIGFVRGSELGGDWGVSFVRKNVSRESLVDLGAGSACFGETCFTDIETYSRFDSYLYGLLVRKFTSFGTIKRRVQIGLDYGGGVGKFSGTVVRRRVTHDFVFSSSNFRDVTGIPRESEETRDVQEFIEDEANRPVVPLVKLEVAVAVLAAPGMKVRVGGGFNFPGYSRVSLSVVYLFGAPRWAPAQ